MISAISASMGRRHATEADTHYCQTTTHWDTQIDNNKCPVDHHIITPWNFCCHKPNEPETIALQPVFSGRGLEQHGSGSRFWNSMQANISRLGQICPLGFGTFPVLQKWAKGFLDMCFSYFWRVLFSDGAFCRWLSNQLANFAVPKMVHNWTANPHMPNGSHCLLTGLAVFCFT